MPLVWRYMLSHFSKIAGLCILTFIAILLAMRLDEIAHFAALGAPLSYILLFTLYQIPYILPLALPISCLIASLILIQRLSHTHELTALRACGFALRDILTPILLAAGFLVLINFWIVSEVSTQAHLTTNALKSELRSINPLLLLHNKHLMRLKGLYFEALGPSRVGESASDVILALPNKASGRLNLLIAERLKSSPTLFIGQGVSLLSSAEAVQDDFFDALFIENIEETVSLVDDLALFLQKTVWTINNDYLKLALLSIRIQEQKKTWQEADASARKEARHHYFRSLSDISRRLSIACAAFTFTLFGSACGIHIGRKRKWRSLSIAILLTVVYLISFFIAKGADHNLVLATSLYLIPQALMILASLWLLRRAARGIE